MQKTNQTTVPANQVMALFADRVWSFSLSRDATLADLAERLTHSDGWAHRYAPGNLPEVRRDPATAAGPSIREVI